jgi:hypothetical protein
MTSYIDVDLSSLKDSEVETKLQELTKKYFAAYRLGKPELLTQLEGYITMYRQEVALRTARARRDVDDDLNQLINVD